MNTEIRSKLASESRVLAAAMQREPSGSVVQLGPAAIIRSTQQATFRRKPLSTQEEKNVLSLPNRATERAKVVGQTVLALTHLRASHPQLGRVDSVEGPVCLAVSLMRDKLVEQACLCFYYRGEN